VVTLKFDPILEAKRQWEARWDGGAPMAAATSIMRAQQIILASVDEAVREFGLTFARYEALVLLSFTKNGSLPLGKMGERLMIHPASVTNIIDRLDAQGLVKRVPHPTDRRAILAEITDEGRRLVKEATDAVVEISVGFTGLTDAETKTLIRLLAKFRKNAGDFI
jgi:DNA-binding MarR family transcriptional regulator